MTGEITIDGKAICFKADTGITVAMAAEEAGIYIPKLCYCEALQIRGNCRVCMVEAVGQDRLIPACSTLAEDGLAVETASPLVISHRKTVVELLLADHNRNCPSCSGNKNCILQQIADDLDIVCEDFAEVFSPQDPSVIPGVMTIRRDLCIRCGRCKAFCREKIGIGAVNLFGRGTKSEYSVYLNPGSDQSCILCGRCTEICPTGCLSRDTQLNRLWSAADGEPTSVVIFFDEDMVALEQRIKAECGYSKERLCGFLKKIGIDRVLWADALVTSGSADKAEAARELSAYAAKCTGHESISVIWITQDIGCKYLVEDSAVKASLQAVLVPGDLTLLLQQALLDMASVEASSFDD